MDGITHWKEGLKSFVPLWNSFAIESLTLRVGRNLKFHPNQLCLKSEDLQ